jgi:quercetin dioxygenase-like cupin family protein
MPKILSEPILAPDDLTRALVLAQADDTNLPHMTLPGVGNTYTILLGGKDTAGKFCLIDMHIPPGGGPALHRHDFEETFILLEGQALVTFRGEKHIVKAGESLHVPANAPHRFENVSGENVRLLCLCAPAGLDEFFKEVGVPVASRTAPAPESTPEQIQAFRKKGMELSPKYRTEALADD